MTDFEQLQIDPASLRSFLVIVKDVGVGFRGPVLPYSDLSAAWAHFLEMLSKYPGDTSSFKLFCVGEFFPLKDDPIELYPSMIEVTPELASQGDLFDHYCFSLFDRFFTKNEKSVYKLAFKDPKDTDAVLTKELREALLKGGALNGQQ